MNIETLKAIGTVIIIIGILGIVGQMDYEDACRADKHCVVSK